MYAGPATEGGSDAAPRGRSSPLPQEELSPDRAEQPVDGPHPAGCSPGTAAPSRSPLAERGLPVRPARSRPSGTRSALRPAPPPGPLAEACSPRSRHGLSQRGGQPRPRALPLGTAAGGSGGSPSPRSRPPLMAAAGVAQSKINPHTASSPHVSSACRPAPHPLAERAPPTPPIDARLFGENG